jgi:hypothetical protein
MDLDIASGHQRELAAPLFLPHSDRAVVRDASRIVFIGHFDMLSFINFASDRAARLDLDVVIEAFGAERFEFVVTGQPSLIDAFEMACSLGPMDCLVLEVLR